jgi:hypothetical protein
MNNKKSTILWGLIGFILGIVIAFMTPSLVHQQILECIVPNVCSGTFWSSFVTLPLNDVKDAGISADGTTIWIEYANGWSGVYLTERLDRDLAHASLLILAPLFALFGMLTSIIIKRKDPKNSCS